MNRIVHPLELQGTLSDLVTATVMRQIVAEEAERPAAPGDEQASSTAAPPQRSFQQRAAAPCGSRQADQQ